MEQYIKAIVGGRYVVYRIYSIYSYRMYKKRQSIENEKVHAYGLDQFS